MLTDGLPAALDWARAGRELSPREWHGAVQADGEGRRPLLLDCRNVYESDVGSFDGAEPVGTRTFSETWDTLRSRPACARHVHGMCMVYTSRAPSARRGTLYAAGRHVHGVCMVCAWYVHGMCMVCTSHVHVHVATHCTHRMRT